MGLNTNPTAQELVKVLERMGVELDMAHDERHLSRGTTCNAVLTLHTAWLQALETIESDREEPAAWVIQGDGPHIGNAVMKLFQDFAAATKGEKKGEEKCLRIKKYNVAYRTDFLFICRQLTMDKFRIEQIGQVKVTPESAKLTKFAQPVAIY